MQLRPKPRILIVDDESVNLSILRKIFRDSSFELTEAVDGLDALEKLEAMPGCDAIFLDWMMPKMDGLELLKRLKADLRFRDIPVIMQTSIAYGKAIEEALSAGAHSYLPKPFDEKQAMQALRSALWKRSARRRP